MFGQFAEPCPVGAWPFGRVVPPPLDGWVVAFGVGVADGSAAKTTATPPTVRRPTARRAVATVRRVPPRSERPALSTGVENPGPGGGEYDAGAAKGDGGRGWAGTAG
jgi:hypothetical protein